MTLRWPWVCDCDRIVSHASQEDCKTTALATRHKTGHIEVVLTFSTLSDGNRGSKNIAASFYAFSLSLFLN